MIKVCRDVHGSVLLVYVASNESKYFEYVPLCTKTYTTEAMFFFLKRHMIVEFLISQFQFFTVLTRTHTFTMDVEPWLRNPILLRWCSCDLKYVSSSTTGIQDIMEGKIRAWTALLAETVTMVLLATSEGMMRHGDNDLCEFSSCYWITIATVSKLFVEAFFVSVNCQ